MATITLGCSSNLWIPPGCSYNLALNYCCSAAPTTPNYNPYSYKREFNLFFTGASRPSIFFTNVSRAGVWADAPMGGWGRGQVRFSTDAIIKKQWVSRWPDATIRQKVFCGLMFHEMGHLILNTTDQSISCPLSAALRARGIAHWGPSTYHGVDEEGMETDSVLISDVSIGFIEWVKVKFLKRYVVTDDVMDEIEADVARED